MPPAESTPREILRNVLIVLGVVLVLYVLYLLRKPLGWLVIATFLAIALSGPVNWLHRRLGRRGPAIALTYIGLLLVPVALAGIVVPPVVTGANDLANNAPRYAADVQDFVQRNDTLRGLEEDYGFVTKIEEEARKLPNRLGGAAGTLRDLGVGLVNSIFAGVTIIVLSIFMVGGGRGWLRKGAALMPPERAALLDRTVDRMAIAVGNYVAGAIAQATIAGITTFIVLTILGVPFAAALAVVVFFFDLIPLVGATIAAIIVGIVTVFVNFPTATIVWVIWAVVYQQLENNVIQPQIQKRALDIHPFVVLVSVLFGSALFGVAGALLAIPVAASAQIAVLEYWRFRHPETAAILEAPLEPPAPPPAPPEG
jgi:predicted PurR-regulated permease PerM